MKTHIFSFFVLLGTCWMPAKAQDRVQHIAVEALGAQNMVGINYDARLRGNDGFGYRVGLGFAISKQSNFFGDKQDIKGVGVPLEVNYLLGKRNSKFEVGFGANLGVYHFREYATYYYVPSVEYPEGRTERMGRSWNGFGYLMFGNVGYRYQRPKGFVFRAGISPSFTFGHKYAIDKPWFFPYIGLGWAF